MRKSITVNYKKPKKKIFWGHKGLIEESELTEEEMIEKGFEDFKI